MNNKLAKISESGKSVLRICKAIGPLVISQTEKASELFAKHQFRLAKVDVAKEFMLKEVESLSRVRGILREKYYASNDDEERIRLRRDIEETECEIRRLDIVSNALDFLPDQQIDEKSSDLEFLADQQITPHWMDKFNEYARANNEDWRKNLLTRALAMEAENPGFIGPRAL